MTPALIAVIGFVTVEGLHPAPRCPQPDQEVGRLVFTDATRSVEVPVTCVSAPALAFSVRLPAGSWRVSFAGEGLSAKPRTVKVAGPSTLLTIAARRSLLRHSADLNRPRTRISSCCR
jgi:hypothetical protein